MSEDYSAINKKAQAEREALEAKKAKKPKWLEKEAK